LNPKTIPEIAQAFRTLRSGRDRIEGYRPLVVAVTRELAAGVPLAEKRLAELADLLGVPEATVAEVARAAEWEEDRLVGIGGLSLKETPHRLSFEGRTLYTWCAWDSLFLVPIIGEPAIISSTSPATGKPVHISIDPDGVGRKDPASAVMSVVVPRPDSAPVTAAEVRETFCHFINFFGSRDEAEAWVPQERDPAVLEVEDGFRLGQLVYGDLVPTRGA
jgi:alkylmercury lyase